MYLALLLAISGAAARGQQLSPELRSKVEQVVRQVLAETGVPSAQIGIARGGKVVYTAAFGDARIAPKLAATASMHYPVGSISKQFTAACVLLLAQDGKLSLDDPVGRWYPQLTRASEVTLRMLISHTSGYSDYAPQDYTIPAFTHPVDPEALVRKWAGKPLDFEPGTKWQYSNTNFVLAGLIVQKVSGMPFWTFVSTRVLGPVGMRDVLNIDTDRDRIEPRGYIRNALAPVRPATLEAPGWYFADAQMAMPASDLLRWDLSLMQRSLLSPASYDAMEAEVKLKDGTGSHYGLGVFVRTAEGRRVIEHSGEVGGFVAENIVYPDDGFAVAVLTNLEASTAAGKAARAIVPLLLGTADAGPAGPRATAGSETQMRAILTGLQAGKLDRSVFTEDCNFYFSPETIEDFRSSLKPLGAVADVKQGREAARGGMTFRLFDVRFTGGKRIAVTTYTMPDGKLEQLLVETAQ